MSTDTVRIRAPDILQPSVSYSGSDCSPSGGWMWHLIGQSRERYAVLLSQRKMSGSLILKI